MHFRMPINQWLFTKYDQLGRVSYTGIYHTTSSRASLQGYVNNHAVLFESRTTNATTMQDGTLVHYTKNAFLVQELLKPY